MQQDLQHGDLARRPARRYAGQPCGATWARTTSGVASGKGAASRKRLRRIWRSTSTRSGCGAQNGHSGSGATAWPAWRRSATGRSYAARPATSWHGGSYQRPMAPCGSRAGGGGVRCPPAVRGGRQDAHRSAFRYPTPGEREMAQSASPGCRKSSAPREHARFSGRYDENFFSPNSCH